MVHTIETRLGLGFGLEVGTNPFETWLRLSLISLKTLCEGIRALSKMQTLIECAVAQASN